MTKDDFIYKMEYIGGETPIMTLTRDEILARRAELPRETVDIPQLGGSVTVRGLMLKEVREFQNLQKASGEALSVYPRIVAWGCIGENGQPLFVGEDIKLIDELPFGAIEAIVKVVLRLSKIGDEEEARPGENGVPKD